MIKNQEYRVWRIVILVFNILLHITIFLSLTNFKISDLLKKNSSYFEYFVFSEGSGMNPNPGTASPVASKEVELKEEQKEEKTIASPNNIVRVNDGVKVFSDSALVAANTDTSNRGSSINMEGTLNDSNQLYTLGDFQGGNGNSEGIMPSPKYELPKFMGGDPNNFSDWLLSKYTLYTERFTGTVNIKLTIDKNGKIKDIEIENCNNRRIKNELLKLVQSSVNLWSPLIVEGRPQYMLYNVPFNIN